MKTWTDPFICHGTTATIALEGATFGHVNVDKIDSYTIQTTVADLSENLTDYVLAFGAYNLGSSTEVTVVTLNSFEVSVIPEPSSYALIGGCLALAYVMVRRRR